jgi:hypothetical protein
VVCDFAGWTGGFAETCGRGFEPHAEAANNALVTTALASRLGRARRMMLDVSSRTTGICMTFPAVQTSCPVEVDGSGQHPQVPMWNKKLGRPA